MKQDYEKIWDGYSKRFDSNEGTKEAAHLGDEWGTDNHSAKLFDEYLLPIVKGQSCVGELGVGGGKHTAMVAPHVQEIYGIDISQEMLNRTVERISEFKEIDFVPVHVDGSGIPLKQELLDAFYSIDSMVHIFPYDFFRYVEEISRILKVDGQGAIEFADFDAPNFLGKFVKDVDYYRSKGHASPGAFGFLSRHAVSKFLDHCALRIERIDFVSARTSIVVFRKSSMPA